MCLFGVFKLTCDFDTCWESYGGALGKYSSVASLDWPYL